VLWSKPAIPARFLELFEPLVLFVLFVLFVVGEHLAQ
jgi:hypothetical protein